MKIKIIDDMPPEQVAMLQALYSRDPKGVDVHLERISKEGAKSFMGTYLIGYGHKSIADCGSTTIFIEGVSMLAAKAIQDWPLYNGQEASTRYMDFSTALFVDPIGAKDPNGGWDIRKWFDLRAFYMKHLPAVQNHLREKYPRKEDEDEKVYTKAIKARAFDIMRGFLPAGAVTNLSWHSTLRQLGDHLDWMDQHVLKEVRCLSMDLRAALMLEYSGSFRKGSIVSGVGLTETEGRLVEYYCSAGDYYRVNRDAFSEGLDFTLLDERIQDPDCSSRTLRDRPRGAELPHWVNEYGQVQLKFLLDFGSYRDLQRHRAGVIRMPLLSTYWGFHPWYLEQLPVEVRAAAVSLLHDVTDWYNASYAEVEEQQQYYLPMGYRVPCKVTMGLKGLVYLLELRTQKTVHPTLRKAMQRAAGEVMRQFGKNVALYADMDPDDWDVRRGKQDIVRKVEAE